MRVVKLSLLVFSLFIVGCSSPYRADYEPDHDFSAYHTYAWLEPNQPRLDALAGNPLWKKRFVSSVDRVMLEHGFVLSDSNEPDFFVNVHGTVQERMRVHALTIGLPVKISSLHEAMPIRK